MNEKVASTDPGESSVPAAPVPTPVRSLIPKTQPSLNNTQATPAAAPEDASVQPDCVGPKPPATAKTLTRQERYMILIYFESNSDSPLNS